MKHTKVEIDINADVGEGMGNDALIMPYISSCNIACGGHVGDEDTIRRTIQLARANHVHVGAHPSFPDRDNFGRKLLTMTKNELTQSIEAQVLLFHKQCEIEETPLHHVKLHGALYNYAAKDAPTADAVVDAIIATKFRPKLYVPYGSVLHRKAENLLPLVFEGFIDRTYMPDGSLVARNTENAVINDKNAAWQQLYQMVTKQSVTTITGEVVALVANTFCIHGDHPNAVKILQYLHEQMDAHQISLPK
tara:strand:- start:119195 stop:119941 length:747 start_codon:yes stop_codon:yes gene_type:complete